MIRTCPADGDWCACDDVQDCDRGLITANSSTRNTAVAHYSTKDGAHDGAGTCVWPACSSNRECPCRA